MGQNRLLVSLVFQNFGGIQQMTVRVSKDVKFPSQGAQVKNVSVEGHAVISSIFLVVFDDITD